ncbi:hypothetical protein TVAG_410470 [Trichomonas vaginalis G3]|uniref:Uncharacterized protein n=1 Tax=Trichomonas vaginalis (strain ATCC PRA-98 / G3) TaxID=412133 RepID=A2E8K6_TRIV3|nr:hypothetical protein TVAGG3_0358500 [Trichomonas vaginalis G3]EAY11043.1 hypothetical protein TVAG_410470 [Trichomonas vaginalis G3]KAI5531783.1 hypothetical protein TVAGG3_0358500 [Trichomonas vaginalis G3]|eukprot:XP_001323266.1 hypothetical protein [Trichomonas vaginalis G3]
MQETKNIITQPPIQMKQEIPPTSRIEPQVPQGPPVSRVEPVAKANVMQIEEPKPMVTPDMWSCLYFVAPVNRFYMSIPLDDEYESFWENQCNEYDCL